MFKNLPPFILVLLLENRAVAPILETTPKIWIIYYHVQTITSNNLLLLHFFETLLVVNRILQLFCYPNNYFCTLILPDKHLKVRL